MTFKVTSNNTERGTVSEMYFSFPLAFKRAFLDRNPFFMQSVSTISQLLVYVLYLYIVLILNELYEPKLVYIISGVNHLKITISFKVAPYSFMTTRALMMRAVVNCAHSHKIVGFFLIFMMSA